MCVSANRYTEDNILKNYTINESIYEKKHIQKSDNMNEYIFSRMNFILIHIYICTHG